MFNWQAVENHVARILKLKKTNRSGAASGDGDLKNEHLMVEVKDQASLKIDSWWEKVRREASGYERVPILVVARPPERIGLPSSSGVQYLVVMDLNDFNFYYSKWVQEYA